MPDLNLFGKKGFQNVPKTESPIEHPEQPKTDKETEPPSKVQQRSKIKPGRSIAWESLIAFLLAVGIGAAVVWYLQYRSDVKTKISEFTIDEFRNLQDGSQ